MQIAKALHPAVPPGFVDWAPEFHPCCTPTVWGEDHVIPQVSLGDRQVDRLPSPAESKDVFAISFEDAGDLHPTVEEDDMLGHILAGRDDCIVKLVKRGYQLSPCADNEVAPLATAITHGSLKTMLTLLRHGADADEIICKPTPLGSFCIDHVLRLTDDVGKLVLLLSYGAETRPMEINHAFSQHRILHLSVYFHWQKYCQQSGHQMNPPETEGELKALISQLPVAEIKAAVDLFAQKQWWLNQLPRSAPKGLEEFWSFLKGPVDY